MTRSKSPMYPNYALPKAVLYAETIFDADRRNPIDRAVAIKHMGYTSVSGASDKAISTMMQYGLLEKVGKGEVRVAQLAVDILHPNQEADKKAALVRAAFNPTLFKTLKDRFPDDRFSDDALRSYLMREGFLERAISPVLSAYTETTAFLAQQKAYESGGAPAAKPQELNPPNDKKFGGAVVGDLVQWESGGVVRMQEPARVRALTDDGHWVFVDGSETGIPMSEVLVTGKAPESTTPPPPTMPLRAAPKAGTTEEKTSLDDGDAILILPEKMSAESVADLEYWLTGVLKKAKRRVATT